MPTLEASGTQTATLTTEHTLATQTNNKVFVLFVDVNAMVGGDKLELRIYYTVLAAGTERLMQVVSYEHAQGELIVQSGPVASDISCKFTLKQTAGTGRAFPWKVLSL